MVFATTLNHNFKSYCNYIYFLPREMVENKISFVTKWEWTGWLSRSSKLFSDLSKRSKIQNVKTLVETTSSERLLRATKVTLFKQGKRAIENLLKLSREYSPDHLVKIRKTFHESLRKADLIPCTVYEA